MTGSVYKYERNELFKGRCYTHASVNNNINVGFSYENSHS